VGKFIVAGQAHALGLLCGRQDGVPSRDCLPAKPHDSKTPTSDVKRLRVLIVGDEDCLKAAVSLVSCRLAAVEQVPSGNPSMEIKAAGLPLRMD